MLTRGAGALRCLWCDEPMGDAVYPTRKKYCSDAHRTYALRDRRRATPVELSIVPPRALDQDGTRWEVVLEAFLGAVANSPQTVRGYRRNCRRACEYLGISSLAELNGAMLAEYRARLRSGGRMGCAPADYWVLPGGARR